jgi:tetratricopeptide (TPR) repeat protein
MKRNGKRSRGGLSGDWVTELRDVASPNRAEAAVSLAAKALEAYGKGDYSRAASLASQAKDQAPRSGRVRELLGLALYHGGNYKQASQELLTYRRLTGSVEQNHVIADCYRALDRPDKALEVCSQVSRKAVSPEVWAEVLIVAAGAAADKGDYVRALKHLDRGELEPRRVEPHHLRLWYARADILEKAGRRREARKAWERLFAEDPDFFDVAERISR